MINIMMKRAAALIGITLCLIFTSTPILASDTTDPYKLMQQVADNTFQRIGLDQSEIARDANHLKTIVIDELMPFIDHRYAARVILYKIKATKAEKKAFYKAFKQYLITTYATVFSKYTDQKVVFAPSKAFADKKYVTVKTKLLSQGIPDINIDFKVRKNKKTGVWKAYDLKALGVSLLDSKKAELSGMLRKHNGVSTVTKLLLEKAQSNIIVNNESARL